MRGGAYRPDDDEEDGHLGDSRPDRHASPAPEESPVAAIGRRPERYERRSALKAMFDDAFAHSHTSRSTSATIHQTTRRRRSKPLNKAGTEPGKWR